MWLPWRKQKPTAPEFSAQIGPDVAITVDELEAMLNLPAWKWYERQARVRLMEASLELASPRPLMGAKEGAAVFGSFAEYDAFLKGAIAEMKWMLTAPRELLKKEQRARGE